MDYGNLVIAEKFEAEYQAFTKSAGIDGKWSRVQRFHPCGAGTRIFQVNWTNIIMAYVAWTSAVMVLAVY